MLMNIISRAAREVSRDPSRLRKVFTIQGIRKIPGFITAQLGSLRKQARERRHAHAFKSDQWAHGDELSVRRYASYEEYIVHQKSKLEGILADGTSLTKPARVAKFRRRFEAVPELRTPMTILCLAARLGHEVEALISLGHFAVGIDLNPGPENRYVVNGDFHSLQFADSSVDCIYTNSLDHALELEKIVVEVKRVLKPGGILLVEIFRGYQEGEVVREFEAMHWPTARSLADKIGELGGFILEAERDPPPQGDPLWPQFVLRRPAAAG